MSSNHKKCLKCEKHKKFEDFYFRKSKNIYNSWCKQCVYDFQKNRWKLRKRYMLELCGGKCCICGYNNNIAALEFHHKKEKDKKYSGSHLLSLSQEKMIKELKKCILLCANCHREIHNPDCNLFNELVPQKKLIDKKILPTGKCPICKKNVYKTKYCCVSHASIGNRKVINRPSKKQLKNELINNSMVKIGKRYNVSDITVKKWLK